MIAIDDHATTFLASVFDPPSSHFFQGYCFVDNDLIFGSQGATQFTTATGNTICGGLDGRYVKVSQQNTSYIFDNDFAGYEALYYYHDGRVWVVSNSFARVVDFLRLHNLPVTPNYAHLSAITSRSMPGQQLFTFATTVREVQVAPPAYSLIVTPGHINLQRRAVAHTQQTTYEEALASYLDTWISRFETLMLDSTADFTTELTGGVDSRANLALLIAAQSRLGNAGQQPRLVSNTGGRYKRDLKVAKSLASRYGLSLNDKRTIRKHELSSKERYRNFRELSLGVYYPLYFPTEGPSPSNISISGGGGGIHRRIYENIHGSNDVNDFIQTYADKAGLPEYSYEFTRDAHRMFDLILAPGEDPLRAHLRDGRVRYHTGRAARFDMSFAPLHSVSAYSAQINAGETRLEQGQFNYDIMNSVDPELVELPYDKNSKLPNDSIRNQLMSVPVHKNARPGRVWRGALSLGRNVDTRNSVLYSEVSDALDDAQCNPFVTAFWGEDLVSQAQALMATLKSGGSIGNAVNGIPIHAMLATDLATPN